MREIALEEYETHSGVRMSAANRDILREVAPSISIAPTARRRGAYDLTPGSEVGVVQTDDLSIVIRPKLPIDRVLFLISYALGVTRFRTEDFEFGEAPDLFEAMIPGFVAQVRRAFRGGLLRGYRVQEEALHGVRGRIRFDDQIRDRYGIVPPVEVRYDEFTEDIELNRLIKAAIVRLGRMRIRSAAARGSLRTFDGMLERVAEVEYQRSDIPAISFDRLNRHYEPAVRLAQLVLRSTSIDLRFGATRASTFLVDMNKVFEDFMVTALREELRFSERRFPQGGRGRRLTLDEGGRVRLRPDLSWWEGRRCVFVGDLKYKKTDRGIPNADIYQLLAYAIAADVPAGLLIYAAGEERPIVHTIRHADQRLRIVAVDISGPPERVLAEVARVASHIRLMRLRPASAHV